MREFIKLTSHGRTIWARAVAVETVADVSTPDDETQRTLLRIRSGYTLLVDEEASDIMAELDPPPVCGEGHPNVPLVDCLRPLGHDGDHGALFDRKLVSW